MGLCTDFAESCSSQWGKYVTENAPHQEKKKEHDNEKEKKADIFHFSSSANLRLCTGQHKVVNC